MFYQQFAKRIESQSIDNSKSPEFDTELIFSKLKQFREEVNQELGSSFTLEDSNIRVQGIRDLSHFPLGFCDIIRDRVYEKSKKEGLVQYLEEKGVVFKKVFGILNNSWFHNVFQIGNYIVDVSRDSIEGFDEFFVATPIKKSNFKNITSYDEVFEIMKKYWKVEVYPNILFPEISLYFPYFLKYLDGEIHFKTTHFSIPLFNEFQSDFKWTIKFLNNNLNFKFDESLHKKFERLNKKFSHLFIQKNKDESLQQYLNKILESRKSQDREKFDAQMMQKIYAQLDSFNRDLNN